MCRIRRDICDPSYCAFFFYLVLGSGAQKYFRAFLLCSKGRSSSDKSSLLERWTAGWLSVLVACGIKVFSICERWHKIASCSVDVFFGRPLAASLVCFLVRCRLSRLPALPPACLSGGLPRCRFDCLTPRLPHCLPAGLLAFPPPCLLHASLHALTFV